MQNLDVKCTIQKIKITKFDIKKEVEELIASGKRNENTDLDKKANNCTANEEETLKVIQEFQEII